MNATARLQRMIAHRWMRLPIRWRLTIWYTALLAAAFLVFGLAISFGLRFNLYHALDDQVEDQGALILASVQEQGGNLRLVEGETADLESDEHFVRLIDVDGRILTDTTREIGDVPLDATVRARAMGGERTLTSVRADGETFRVVTAPVMVGNEVRGVLQVGISREDSDEAIGALILLFGVAGPLALAGAVMGGYTLAGRAMAPVAAITHLAASVDADDLDARLRLDLPNDELGELAATFDVMLGRIGESFERQRRFTGDAAHELRTPLSLMRSRVDLALLAASEQGADDVCTETLGSLQGDIDRLTGLVGNLLTLARADARELVVNPARCDLADVVETTAETFAPQFADAGITLRTEASACSIVADADLLVQVLVNLIANSLAHTRRGGKVEVGCECRADRGVIWVADDGAGIAPEHQGRVFGRFYRVDPGRARAGGGAGLGLSISHAIVEAHGGEIDLQSAVGQGTRVEVRLPVVSAGAAKA
jgi:signal transduction histidine kinase